MIKELLSSFFVQIIFETWVKKYKPFLATRSGLGKNRTTVTAVHN